MANKTLDLRSEERRRQVTLMLLGGLLFVTTIPVVNQRALFSPFGDVAIIGDLSPVAYAATFGTPFFRGERPGSPRGSERSPNAFAVRAPGEPFVAAPSTGGSPGTTGNAPAPFSPAGAQTGGGGIPGGGTSGGGGGSLAGAVGAVPEPGTWLTMILGFAVVGSIMRRARRRDAAYQAAGLAKTVSEG